MTIDEAIKTLTSLRHGTIWPTPRKEKDAIKLGIEALEFLERWRSKAEIQPYPLLRSETID